MFDLSSTFAGMCESQCSCKLCDKGFTFIERDKLLSYSIKYSFFTAILSNCFKADKKTY